MFNNIAGKIKALAKVTCWFGIIAYVIIGMIIIGTNEYLALAGILIAVVGPFFSWICSLILYGFGQLLENSDIIAEQSARTNKEHNEPVKQKQKAKKQNNTANELVQQKAKKQNDTAEEVISYDIFSNITYVDIICPNCKEQLSYPKQELTDNETLTCPMCDVSFKTSPYK